MVGATCPSCGCWMLVVAGINRASNRRKCDYSRANLRVQLQLTATRTGERKIGIMRQRLPHTRITALFYWFSSPTPVCPNPNSVLPFVVFLRRDGSCGVKTFRITLYSPPACLSRPVATAVASSGSHLETGRSVSGVLENCIEAGLNTFGAFVSGTITG